MRTPYRRFSGLTIKIFPNAGVAESGLKRWTYDPVDENPSSRGFESKRAQIPSPAYNPLAYGAAKKRRLYNQMEKFIVVNGRILDFEKYKADFSLMQKIISLDMREYFIKLGFRQRNAAAKKSFRNKLDFYNRGLDFEITVKTNKKQKPQFV